MDFQKDNSTSTGFPKDSAIIRFQQCPKFETIIGFQEAKDYLSTCIHASNIRSTLLEHVLVCGPSYIDKLSFALAIAGEMGRDVRHVNFRDLKGHGDLAGILCNLFDGCIVILEHCDCLKKDLMIDVLYPALKYFSVPIPMGGDKQIQLDFPHFIAIGTCTRTDKLTSELRQAFGITVKLQKYTPDMLVLLLKNEAKAEDIPLMNVALLAIAERSGGNPVRARQLYRRIQDYAIVNKESCISSDFAKDCMYKIRIAEKSLS